MAKALRWILGALAIIVLTALVEPWLVKLFGRWGFYEAPTDPWGSIMNWIERVAGVSAFPWIASGIIGLFVGAWLDWVARRIDGWMRATPSEQSDATATEVGTLRERVADYSDEVSDQVLDALRDLVREEDKDKDKDTDKGEAEIVDGPAW